MSAFFLKIWTEKGFLYHEMNTNLDLVFENSAFFLVWHFENDDSGLKVFQIDFEFFQGPRFDSKTVSSLNL